MDITVYTRRGCGFAQGLFGFINALGVPHRVVNIDLDPQAMERIKALGERTDTPFVDFGDGHIVKQPTNQDVLQRLKEANAIPPA
ncbi:MAG: glutaredoxin family protein [Armatimonadota bacterium]|nr:glutaredoxin family protein [Armatimonadota bacterium]